MKTQQGDERIRQGIRGLSQLPFRLRFRLIGVIVLLQARRQDSLVLLLTRLEALLMNKAITLFLLLVSCPRCFAQTDTNVIAVGDWSEPVKDKAGYTLRGRLLLYDAERQKQFQRQDGVWNQARVYLELQHVMNVGWDRPIEIPFDVVHDLHFELHNVLDLPMLFLPIESAMVEGTMPEPYWITLPCDSTVRLRADWLKGSNVKPNGLGITVSGGIWNVRTNDTNNYVLSATFSPNTNHPPTFFSVISNEHDPHYHLWQGTLNLPKVKIPPPKQ